MRTRSSSNLIAESSTTLKRRNRRRSKERFKPFSLEETEGPELLNGSLQPIKDDSQD
ncbi:hypothetical protein Tco_0552283, partial [Tanacetum coccineum]